MGHFYDYCVFNLKHLLLINNNEMQSAKGKENFTSLTSSMFCQIVYFNRKKKIGWKKKKKKRESIRLSVLEETFSLHQQREVF